MQQTEPQHVCTHPFEWFEIHPDGSCFLCCPTWLKRPIGNLLRQPLDEIWNGPVAKEIRKSIHNGRFHNCSKKRCPHLLTRSGPVCRPEQLSDPQLKKAIEKKNSRLPFLPHQLNLCFDHSCNLACQSCRPQVRVARGKALEQAQKISRIVQTELIQHAHSITLSGFGDPFGSPTYLDLLKQLNRHDFPKLEQVRLHTNGQLLSREMWQSLPDLWPLVKEIEISIDAATEQIYQLNRPGGSFSRLLRNIEHLGSTDCELTLSMVVQKNNWQEIPQFVKLAQGFGARAYFSQLVNWGTFSKEEFKSRAVHLNCHPEYLSAKRLIQKHVGVSGVVLGNLNISFGLD